MILLYFFIALGASIAGAISGIGGGIIIKPVFDGLGTFDVGTISFLSGCTVLSMTTMTLLRSRKSTVKLNKRVGTLLAAGGVAGGLVGKYLFDILREWFGNDKLIGASQSILLLLMTSGVIVFTIYKGRIKPLHRDGNFFCLLTGLLLGSIAAFLGIGGGPINLAVLYLFFSMDSKTAALNSIYIIFFSQLTSLLFSIASGNVPEFNSQILLAMITGGVLGGVAGPYFSGKLSHRGIDKLFTFILCGIIVICIYNLFRWVS